MARNYSPLLINESDRNLLVELASRDKECHSDIDRKLATRAKMVLACGVGTTITSIAEELHERPNTVIKWRDRYKELGLPGLYDKKKSGRTKKYDDSFRDILLEKLKEKPPENTEGWDGPSLAKALDAPVAVVWAILRKEKITLARRRMWEIPSRNSFLTTPMTVTGVFLSPQMNAVIILSGEMSEISKDAKLVCPNKSAYDAMNVYCGIDGRISLYDALDGCSKTSSGIDHIKPNAFQLFVNKVVENRNDEYLLALIEGGEPNDVNLQWKINHPNFVFHYVNHSEWKNEIELLCKLFWVQDHPDLPLLLTDCVENKCHFEWYQ